MKLVCPGCGMRYESGKFCQECGTKLIEYVPQLVCPSCGYKAKSGKFCQECGTKLCEELFVPAASKNDEAHTVSRDIKKPVIGLPMDAIREAAQASYPKASLKVLANAALKIAEVINKRLRDSDVLYMVHPTEFDSNVSKDALPIHFLFRMNGIPKVAVVAVTENGYKTPRVVETEMACRNNRIEYIRVYADGYFADWMEADADPETVEFCNNWLVEKIINGLTTNRL